MRLGVRSLALLSGLRIQRCLEQWCRPAATAPIQPLAWAPPYAKGAAQENGKKTKKKKKSVETTCFIFIYLTEIIYVCTLYMCKTYITSILYVLIIKYIKYI